MFKYLILIITTVAGMTLTIAAQPKATLLELVERAVTDCDSTWQAKPSTTRDRVNKYGHFEWSKGNEVLTVTITAYPRIETAIRSFTDANARNDNLLEIKKLFGFGDEAFTMFDKVESLAGISFRKGGANVLIISDSNHVSLRMAQCVANVIPTGTAYTKLVPEPVSSGVDKPNG